MDEFLGWRLTDERYDTELWKFQYDRYPYMKNMSADELQVRYLSICNNIYFLVSHFRDVRPIRAHFTSIWWWLKKRFQMHVEYENRQLAIPFFTLPTDVSDTGQFPTLPLDDCVVRYGDLSWLEPMLTQGRIRIAPGDWYLNSELDAARRDDELNKTTITLGDTIKITMPNGVTGPIIGDLKRTSSLPKSSIHLLCTSLELDHRLFAAFPIDGGAPSNGCIIIWDSEEFARRLEIAAQQTFSRSSFHHLSVMYYDPYEVGFRQHISPGANKVFSYAYQREYRFMWFTPSGRPDINEPLFINVGDIRDIAGLFDRSGICLGGQPFASRSL